MIVCVDIKATTDRKATSQEIFYNEGWNSYWTDGMNRRWTLGHCSSAEMYIKDAQFTETCCLPPGNHTLTCDTQEQARGWKSAYLEIEGHTYCDDFISYKALRKVEIEGKKCNLYVSSITELYPHFVQRHPWYIQLIVCFRTQCDIKRNIY